MSLIHLTINGRELTGQSGQTVLDVARANGVHIPTLCWLDGLPNLGGCRLCIVDIQGQRRPVPACTTPAEQGMIVQTSTPVLEDLRHQTLELLFSERNHICPFCPRSGYCELQSAGYEHKLDHVRYDYCMPVLEMDNSHQYIAMDPNRCILCSRCIRACDQWVGKHVLDLDHRGFATQLIADNGVPMGESSCVSCGTCVSVCPTGALFEKRSAHWQGRLPLELTETICPGCGVGCRINASVRHRQIGELRPARGANAAGVLCKHGRFELVNPTSPRVTEVRVKRGNQWVDRPLPEVVEECARRLSAAPIQEDPSRVVAFVSPRLPLETIAACQSFITKCAGSPRWSILDRTNTPAIREALKMNGFMPPVAGLKELEEADLIMLIGCNLERDHGTVGSYVRRSVQHRRTKLIKINPHHTWLKNMTDLHVDVERGKDSIVLAALLKYLMDEGKAKVEVPKELVAKLAALDDATITASTGVPAETLKEAARLYAAAKKPMIVCSVGITRHPAAGLAAALNLVKATDNKTEAGRWRFMELATGANSAGARLLGDQELSIESLDPQSADIAFLVLGDDDLVWHRHWIDKLRAVSFVVALVAREHPIADVAQVVIPTASWAERSGTFVNLEARLQKSRKLMEPLSSCIEEAGFFQQVARAWRGPECAWAPPKLPEILRDLSDGQLVPCKEGDRDLDLSGLASLAE
jgi:formate dehydrogenase major subunit